MKFQAKPMNTNQLMRAAMAVSMILSASTNLNAAAIAYWKFEPQNLAADSSGNGLDLSITDITSSAEKDSRAPGSGSGAFAGTAFGQTISDLDLSAYQGVTFE